ncbi:MAG TPA: 6-phosphogluconolactonase [Candidatus Baltobacteraceae bacterium]|nr:6-phosphogluconolactonase [Candidatus Baltobacteraceae bacterium]
MTREQGHLLISDTPAQVARALAETFVGRGRGAIEERGRFAVSLAGGTTPKAAYALLAQPPYANALDWKAIEVFFGDERCVPPDHDQSNYKMANDAFIQPLHIPPERVHRMRGEDDPRRAAAAYRVELIGTLGPQPRFDLVMLGMGPDGHTASLFPGTDPLTHDEELVRAVYSQSQAQWRITLTPQVLNGARTVVFAVEGAAKAATLAAVREGPYDPTTYPAQIIAPADGELIWLVDKAAAGVS